MSSLKEMVMTNKITFLVLFFLIIIFEAAPYQDNAVQLGEIVVTPLRFEESSSKIPASTQVIDRQEILSSSSQSVVDVLRDKIGVIVRDYTGTGVQSQVDLRGFGETAGMNTLVLVDGRRTNEMDLSGTSWTQIPLEKIERIEIIRGSGNVLYGDNAEGGVINIITRKGQGKPSFTLNTQGGSYEMHRQNLLVEGSRKLLSYSLGLTNYSTLGYRDNSEYKSRDSWAQIIYSINESLSLSLNGSFHSADFGLPGALRESQLNTLSRRQTLFSEDNVKEEDWYIDIGVESDLQEYGKFKTNASFRRRNVENELLSSLNIDGRRIDTLGIRNQYVLNNDILSRENSFTLGVDFYRADSIIDAYSYTGLLFYNTGQKTSETDIDKESLGFYFQDILSITDNLTFTGGLRYEKAEYSFNFRQLPGPWTLDVFFWPIAPVQEGIRINEKASNAGLSYQFREDLSVFFNYSQGFRFAASDEYYSVFANPPVNTQLKPQTSQNYELGATSRIFEKLKLSLALFSMKIKNELFYNPLNFTNENYDRTKHRGVEFGLECKLNDTFRIKANYVYNRAFFDKGQYSRNQIPMVPYHKASFGLETDLKCGFKLDLLANFVGERYFISDQPHNYPRLDYHSTVDLKLSHEYKDMDIFFKINNLFNEEYSELGAISLMYAERGYYPSPERNFTAGVSLKF